MNDNKTYLQGVISQTLGQRGFDPHKFLGILRNRCRDLIPPSRDKETQAMETCYFFNVAWHCFQDTDVIGPAVRGLFYDFHTYIGECAPSKLRLIRYNRDDESCPFDDEEKRIIVERVLPALQNIIVEPPAGGKTIGIAGGPVEKRAAEQVTGRPSGQKAVAPAQGVRIIPFPRFSSASKRQWALYSARPSREGVRCASRRYGHLDYILTVPEMHRERPSEDLKTDD